VASVSPTAPVSQPVVAGAGLTANAEDVANTTLAGNQFVRSADALSNGGYAVAWASGASLFVQRYDAQGVKSGGETRIAYDVAAQENPAIAVLRDGTVVVASAQSRPDWVIALRRFDASGGAIGAESTIASPVQLAQAVLRSLDDGGFALGWASVESGAFAQHVQRFDAQARPAGAQVDFAAAGADRNVALKLVAMPGGNFIAGTTHRFNGTPYVQYRIGANTIGALFDANAGLPELNTTLLPLADGRLALWSSASSGGYVQMFDATGAALAAPAKVDVVPDTAAAMPDGGWVTVTRQMRGLPSLAQRFDASGNANGDPVEIAGDLSRPLPVAAMGGAFALAWTFTGALGDADVKTQRIGAR
jgi:hypothetical protein